MFQISSNQVSASQIAKSDSPYMRLYGNNCDISLFLQIDYSLNFLTQFTQSIQTVSKYGNAIIYANVMVTIEDFVISKKINYAYIALSQNKFVLPNLPITVNVKRHYTSYIKIKKHLMTASMKINGF